VKKILYKLIDVWFKYKFREEWVFKDLSLEIEEDVWVIAGPNGGGKTTLVKLLIGVLKPLKGSIYLQGKLLKALKDAREKIVYLPTNIRAYLIGPRVQDEFDRIEDSETALEILRKNGIDLDLKKPIYHLSEGQMRILADITALFSKKDIIFLDEPTIGLDKRYRKALVDAIRLQGEKKSIFVVTNDTRLLTLISKMIYVDGNGGVIVGNTRDLIYEISDINDNAPIVQFATMLGLSNLKFLTREELKEFLRREGYCRAFS